MKSTTLRFAEVLSVPYPAGPRAVNAMHGFPDGVPLDQEIAPEHRDAAAAILRSQVVEIEAEIREDGSVRFSIVDHGAEPPKS